MAWEKDFKNFDLYNWFLHSGDPMMQALMDKNTGWMQHFETETNNSNTMRGKPLEFKPTPEGYWDAIEDVFR
ncbi:MAG: hypothetical protein LBM13_03615 [Candidatus Ancillula sp.]|jgi:hypothetical protein|nr:hypothetical protein [Candidatus Ancillula sp.]